jgi:hypothetical protein
MDRNGAKDSGHLSITLNYVSLLKVTKEKTYWECPPQSNFRKINERISFPLSSKERG